jgi:adenylate cyclase
MATRASAPVNSSNAGNGTDFEHWLIARSFAMLPPLSRLGLLVSALMLAVIDPMLFAYGIWGDNPQHHALLAWHSAAGLYFAVFLGAARRMATHRARKLCLASFMSLGAAFFTWFGFISWNLSGDMSTYAIFLLTMVCVFSYPGALRKALNIASATVLLLAILWLDGSSVFYTSGAAINLVALAVVALLLDAHMMTMSRALYDEKRRVEHERARADAVLYNALPMAIANELKSSNTVKAQKHDRIAVLFVDIVGFTRFAADHPPDTVLHMLDSVFTEFDALVDRHAVEKIKTIGDAYMAIGKDNVAAIADLALDMREAVAAFNLRSGLAIAVRAGMHVGPAITGVIGFKRLHYDVWGDAVNIASRMESTGETGKIQVTEDVRRALCDTFLFGCQGMVEVKGKGPMHTCFLLGRSTRPAAAQASATPRWTRCPQGRLAA